MKPFFMFCFVQTLFRITYYTKDFLQHILKLTRSMFNDQHKSTRSNKDQLYFVILQ